MVRDAAWWSKSAARLGEVGAALEAAGADGAESTVRKLLAGLGFTEEMMDGPSTTLSGQ